MQHTSTNWSKKKLLYLGLQQNVHFRWCSSIGHINDRWICCLVIVFSKITYIMHKETCQWSTQKSEYHTIVLFASLLLFTATETPILQYMVFLHYPVCFSVCIEYVTRQVFKSIDIILTWTFQDLLHLVCHKHHCMFMTTCI